MFSAPEFNPNVPAFISKLWHMLCDTSTDDLICWSKEGSSFVIRDQARFSIELLPKYYKHNNMASFIRQLNMYGFHKVLSVESATMKNDGNELGFSHPYFMAGCPHLLDRIKRKMTNNREVISDFKGDPKLVNKLLHEVQQLQNKQELFDSKLAAMKNENDALWREHSILRQTHAKQQKIVNKLIQFLVTLVQQSGLNVKRSPLPLMIKDGGNRSSDPINIFAENVQGSPSGPIICEVDPGDVIYEQSIIQDESQIAHTNENRMLLITMKTSGNTLSKFVQSSLNKIIPSKNITELDQTEEEISVAPTSNVVDQLSDKPPNKSLMGSITSKSKPDRKRKYYSVFEDEDLNTPGGLVYLDDDSSMLKENLDDSLQVVQEQMVFDGSGSKEKEKNNTSDSTTDISLIDIPILSSNEIVTDIKESKEQSGSVIPEPSDDGNGEIIMQSNIDPDRYENKDLSLVPSDQNSHSLTGEFNNHLEVMQSDLDILKDILKGEGLSLDASTLLELFSSEDPLALNMTEIPDYEKQLEESGGIGTELIAYPHLFLDNADPSKLHEENVNYSGPDLNIPASSNQQSVCLLQDSHVKYNEP